MLSKCAPGHRGSRVTPTLTINQVVKHLTAKEEIKIVKTGKTGEVRRGHQ